MAAILHPAAVKMNADKHANTATSVATAPDLGPTPEEITRSLVGTEYGDLAPMISGGHTTVGRVIETPLAKATDSVRGKLGGLVSRTGSPTAPGPTVQPASAKIGLADARHTAAAAKDAGTKALGGLRKRLGI